MKLSRDDILKLAKLSRLQLTDDEIAQYQAELSAILDYVQTLENVDTTGLQPTYQVTGLTTLDPNAAREDEVTDQVSHEELMKNVSDHQDGMIKVKRMVG